MEQPVVSQNVCIISEKTLIFPRDALATERYTTRYLDPSLWVRV